MKIPERNAGDVSSAQIRGTPTLLSSDRRRGSKRQGGNGNRALLGAAVILLPSQVTLGNMYEAPEPEGEANDSEGQGLPGGLPRASQSTKCITISD